MLELIFQSAVIVTSVICVAVTFFAILAIRKSPNFSYKPLWYLGSLLGFFGVGIYWNHPDDLYLQFGIQIPPIMIFQMASSGDIMVKALFPIVAAVALFKANSD